MGWRPDEEEEAAHDSQNADGTARHARLGKTHVDTTFLPDHERAEGKREHDTGQSYNGLQTDAAEGAPITVTYSYWDGRGHRKQVTMKQGNTIESFKAVKKEFRM